MNTSTRHAGRRRSIIAVAASVVLALVGAVIIFMATRTSQGPPQPAASTNQALSPAATPAPVRAASPTTKTTTTAEPTSPANGPGDTDLGPVLEASPPVGIDIPAIGVRTRNLVDLALSADGTLQVPTDFSSVGWYTAGPTPGELGPAILAGHVDSHNGPAIFYRLGALRPGARVTINRNDGKTATFSIDRVQRFPKDHFPTALVYGSTNRAELRLITCGGSFDHNSGHYIDNIVAFAHLVSPGTPDPAASR